MDDRGGLVGDSANDGDCEVVNAIVAAFLLLVLFLFLFLRLFFLFMFLFLFLFFLLFVIFVVVDDAADVIAGGSRTNPQQRRERT